MEAIANGPLPQLFALMMMPIIAAILLGGFLIFFAVRRRKKPKMKHGLHTSKVEVEEVTNSDESSADELEINTNVLSSDIPPAPIPSSNQIASSIEERLDLGLLGKNVETEVVMEDTSKPTYEKSFDLSARLSPPSADTTTPSPQTTEPVELLRLLRDPQSGQLIVEIAGQRYTKLADITDKKVGQFILKLTAHLLAFSNGVIITDAGMKSVYKPKWLDKVPLPIGPSPTPASQSSRLSTETPAAARQKTESNTAESPPVPKPSPETDATPLASSQESRPQPPISPPQPGGLLGRVAQPAPPPPSIPGLNLAEEINDIVQARLRYSPLAQNNRIEITSDLSGGIRIEVNNQFYSSPDDVPDPEIKELIKASIKEWERT